MYLLEAMASGVPVVQPALGAFPEIIDLSGGGVTYMPNTPQKLSETWAELLNNPDKMEELSIAAQKGTKAKFNIHNHAKEIIQLYESLKK
jgi:glycosyltransferase involved in cell wall biosynthesis